MSLYPEEATGGEILKAPVHPSGFDETGEAHHLTKMPADVQAVALEAHKTSSSSSGVVE